MTQWGKGDDSPPRALSGIQALSSVLPTSCPYWKTLETLEKRCWGPSDLWTGALWGNPTHLPKWQGLFYFQAHSAFLQSPGILWVF